MRVLHRLGQVAHRCAVGEHHMDIHPQSLRMQTPGIGDTLGPVEEIACRLGVEHHAPVRLDAALGRDEQMLDVFFLDPAPADLDLDRRDAARQPGTRAADPDARDARPGQLLRPLDRVAHGVGRGRHVGDVSAPDSLRGAVPATEHDHLAALGQARDHRRNPERTDVDRAEHARNSGLAGHQVPSSMACSARPGTRM